MQLHDDRGRDFERFRLPAQKRRKGIKKSTKSKKPRIKGYFLKGPIPWDWLEHAARLPGKALHVAVSLWFKSGLMKSESVPMSQSILRGMGARRQASYRGLECLEKANLVSVIRIPGRNSIVTLLETDMTETKDDDQSE